MKRFYTATALSQINKAGSAWLDTSIGLKTTQCISSLRFLCISGLQLLPKKVKPNPFETSSGRYDKSFEKIAEHIEKRLPGPEDMGFKGTLADRPFGGSGFEKIDQERKEEVQGISSETPAAREARSYFTGADLSPAAMHVRSPKLKVAQEQHRLSYDKRILKTSMETDEYYYPQLTFAEKQRRNRLLFLS